MFQESFLFAASVRENIALDDTVDGDEVVRAAMIASADRFIRELPERATTPWSASAATRCRAGSASGSRWRGRSRARRGS